MITPFKSILLIIGLLSGICIPSKGGTKYFHQDEIKGLIIFEGHGDMYDLYFVPGDFRHFYFLAKKDTVHALILQASGWGSNAYFKSAIGQRRAFDSTRVMIRQDNHLGQRYEDTVDLLSMQGRIQFDIAKSYKLAKRYKEVVFPSKTLVIELENYGPIEDFKEHAAGK